MFKILNVRCFFSSLLFFIFVGSQNLLASDSAFSAKGIQIAHLFQELDDLSEVIDKKYGEINPLIVNIGRSASTIVGLLHTRYRYRILDIPYSNSYDLSENASKLDKYFLDLVQKIERTVDVDQPIILVDYTCTGGTIRRFLGRLIKANFSIEEKKVGLISFSIDSRVTAKEISKKFAEDISSHFWLDPIKYPNLRKAMIFGDSNPLKAYACFQKPFIDYLNGSKLIPNQAYFAFVNDRSIDELEASDEEDEKPWLISRIFGWFREPNYVFPDID